MNLFKIAVVMVSLSSLTAFGKAGGVGTRGGGEATSQAFVSQAWTTYYQLSNAYPGNVPVIDLERFKNAIETTRVDFVKDPLVLDGIEKDAINDIEARTILVNVSRYSALTTQQQKKLGFHEYLRLAGVDDSKYQVSNPVILALEGDPIVMLEDAANLALIKLSTVSRASPQTTCFDLATFVPLLRQMARYAKDSKSVQGQKFHSFSAHRLDLWSDKPYEYCKVGKFYTTEGKIEKAKSKRLNCYLTLIERDLKIMQMDIARYQKREVQGQMDVWRDYSKRAEKACN